MRVKVPVYRKIILFLPLIGMLALSGCGHNGELSSDTVVREGTDAGAAETEGRVDTEDKTEAENKADTEGKVETEDSETAGSTPGQPAPLEVPVSSEALDIPYHGVEGIDISAPAHSSVSDGENMYLACGTTGVYAMPIGTGEPTLMNLDNPERMIICHIAMDIYGKLHLLVADSNSDRRYIWRLNESNQVEEVIDISDYFETNWMPLWFLVDKDGNYYLQWVLERDGLILDREGALKHSFTMESLGTRWTYEAAVGKDGLIYVVYNDGDEKVRIGQFDVESCAIIKEDSPLYFTRDEIFNGMSRGTDTNILLFSRYSGVWAYDQEKGILENRAPLSDIGLARGGESYPLTFLPDGRFVLLQGSKDGVHIKYIPAGK